MLRVDHSKFFLAAASQFTQLWPLNSARSVRSTVVHCYRSFAGLPGSGFKIVGERRNTLS